MEEALQMDSCSDYSLDILRYLDNQLSGAELNSFLDHLKICHKCTVQMEEEQALSQLLRRSRPLYAAPLAFRARISEVLNQPPARRRTSEWLYGRIMPILRDSWRGLAHYSPRWSLALPALLVALVGLIFLPDAIQHVSAASYVAAATAAHRSYLDGTLPLEIQSDSPEVVTAWFSGKLPFSFRLPSPQRDPAGRSTYRLNGASLVKYKGSSAALVTYETANKEPISLLVTSARLAAIAGGAEVQSGPLVFHYRAEQGFEVITWTNKNLAYALVSAVSGSPRQSCLVCHQTMRDHDPFKSSP